MKIKRWAAGGHFDIVNPCHSIPLCAVLTQFHVRTYPVVFVCHRPLVLTTQKVLRTHPRDSVLIQSLVSVLIQSHSTGPRCAASAVFVVRLFGKVLRADKHKDSVLTR